MDQIRIDPSHLFASSVGDLNGIARSDLDARSARRAAGLAGVREAPETDHAALVEPILDYVASTHARFRAVVVLAGHAEAPLVRAIRTALVSPYADLAAAALLPRLLVYDEADPDVVGEFLDVFDASECLFLVASRDGNAPEALAPFRIVRHEIARKLGDEGHKDHVVFACEPVGGELGDIARHGGYVTFASPPMPARGMQSALALSSIALLPAALVGVDVKGLLAGSSAMSERCGGSDWEANPALLLAAAHDLLAAKRPSRRALACAYGHRLHDLAGWIAEASVRPGQLAALMEHDDQAWVTLLAVDRADHTVEMDAGLGRTATGPSTLNELFVRERERMRSELTRLGHPNLTVHFPNVTAHTVGQFIELVHVARLLRRGAAPSS